MTLTKEILVLLLAQQSPRDSNHGIRYTWSSAQRFLGSEFFPIHMDSLHGDGRTHGMHVCDDNLQSREAKTIKYKL